jgi:hypothetical protein
VTATLAWNLHAPRIRYAAVRLARPTATAGGGIAFTALADRPLPHSLAHASLLIDRAPGRTVGAAARAGFPQTQTYMLTAVFEFSTEITSYGGGQGNVALPSLSCVGNTEWTSSLLASSPSATVPELTCSGTTIDTSPTPTTRLTEPTSAANGTVFFSGNVLSNGDVFPANAIIASWSSAG